MATWSSNRYALASGNPLSFVEADGHCVFDESGASGAIGKHDCSLDDFSSLTVDDRIRWMNQFMVQFARFGTENWFNNIVGILHFARDQNLITPGSWFSWVDATILHAIQDGMQLFRGAVSASSTEGAAEWSTFFGTAAGGSAGTYELRRLWATAEQKATDWGENIARINGTQPSHAQWVTGILFGGLYRSGVRQRGSLAPLVMRELLPPYLGDRTADWYFDPRSKVPISGLSPVYYAANAIYEGVERGEPALWWLVNKTLISPPLLLP